MNLEDWLKASAEASLVPLHVEDVETILRLKKLMILLRCQQKRCSCSDGCKLGEKLKPYRRVRDLSPLAL